jgi:predicted transcriptional regulator of viral defense system
LDALGYPLHCGGESVVFEVWERGAARWNQDRLADYLLKINRLEIDRRVGAMTDVLQIKIDSKKLRDRLDGTKAQMKTSQDGDVALLPGFTYPNVNSNWKVCVP